MVPLSDTAVTLTPEMNWALGSVMTPVTMAPPTVTTTGSPVTAPEAGTVTVTGLASM